MDIDAWSASFASAYPVLIYREHVLIYREHVLIYREHVRICIPPSLSP